MLDDGRSASVNECAKPQKSVLSPEQLDLLTEIERRDNIFSEVDFRSYISR